MKKISVYATNDLCPQTLFVYGSMNEDDTPDFGLFCWFSYCWFDQLGVICAIGGRKRTLENIRRNGVFSANLVVEDNLPLADYFGTADGRDHDKMDVAVRWEKGAVLTVPILCSSPVKFYSVYDWSIGEHLEKASIILESFDENEEYLDINKVIELYNIQELLIISSVIFSMSL